MQNIFTKYNPKAFLDYLNKEIQYGFIDKYGRVYNEMELNTRDWANNYALQIEDRLANTKIGHCWDFVELERFYFDRFDVKNKSYFAYDKKLDITHTFLLYFENNKANWIESAWGTNEHIGVYSDEDKAILDIKNKLEKSYSGKTITIVQYNKPYKAFDQFEFINFCIGRS